MSTLKEQLQKFGEAYVNLLETIPGVKSLTDALLRLTNRKPQSRYMKRIKHKNKLNN